MDQLELLLRASGIGFVLMLVAACAAAGSWRRRLDVLAVWVGVAAYLVCSSPLQPCVAAIAFMPVLAAAIAFPFAFWRLARVILDEAPDVPALAWLGLAVLLGCGLTATNVETLPHAWRLGLAGVTKAVAAAFIVHALVRAWRTWDDDLVESRRKLRWWLVGLLGGYALVVTGAEVYLHGEAPPGWLALLNVVAIDLSLLGSGAFLVGLRQTAVDALFSPTQRDNAVAAEPAQRPSSDDDAAALGRLDALMKQKMLYRDPDLSVHALARSLGLPEYRLRNLINRRLGHRNFAAFVNAYRLDEVAARLTDPQLDRRPVLTLALEAGFGSIGPFNRCFRERYGVTPTEFRSRRGAMP